MFSSYVEKATTFGIKKSIQMADLSVSNWQTGKTASLSSLPDGAAFPGGQAVLSPPPVSKCTLRRGRMESVLFCMCRITPISLGLGKGPVQEKG